MEPSPPTPTPASLRLMANIDRFGKIHDPFSFGRLFILGPHRSVPDGLRQDGRGALPQHQRRPQSGQAVRRYHSKRNHFYQNMRRSYSQCLALLLQDRSQEGNVAVDGSTAQYSGAEKAEPLSFRGPSQLWRLCIFGVHDKCCEKSQSDIGTPLIASALPGAPTPSTSLASFWDGLECRSLLSTA